MTDELDRLRRARAGVKPENVLLSEGHALVTDFGIAKAVSRPATSRSPGPAWPSGRRGTWAPSRRRAGTTWTRGPTSAAWRVWSTRCSWVPCPRAGCRTLPDRPGHAVGAGVPGAARHRAGNDGHGGRW